MWTLLGISLLYLFPAFAEDAQWKNYNCPAPRSPANGVSFIFHDGALVRYKCHPGYVMRGRAYARCIKNRWDRRTPVCLPRSDLQEFQARTSYTEMPKGNQHYTFDEASTTTARSLFDWEKEANTPPYGDGPNRLPVINGIWKTSPRPSIHLFTIGSDSSVAKDLIREEINIAEVRQKQLEEVQKSRTGYKTVPKYQPVENLRASAKPRYHGSISVIVLPSESDQNQKSEGTTKRPRRRKGKDRRGKNRKGRNKNKYSSKELRHKPEGRVSTKPQDDWNYRWNGYNSVHQRESRPYQPSRTYHHPSDQPAEDLNTSQYDDTCYETIRGKRIPLRAPQVPNAFVYKYDSRKHYSNPDTYYLVVHYRCRYGYTLRDKDANKLYCKNGQWVGETPLCEL